MASSLAVLLKQIMLQITAYARPSDSPAAQVFLLQIKASLENVAKISLPEGHEYCIDVTLPLYRSF